MGRVLAMTERRIEPSMRQQYLDSLSERRVLAAGSGAHFWVFEHASDAGRFVEFTEGGSEESIRAASDDAPPASLWREVQGG